MMQRGDIHYIVDYKDNVGSEQGAGRPAIIVSNDMCNQYSPVVEVVFLTTKPKSDLPTHVTIRSCSKVSIALCEQVTSVSIERVGDYSGTCTKQEMDAIDTALCTSLALNLGKTEVKEPVLDDTLINDLRNTIHKLSVERDMYKNTYDDLLNRILKRG